MSLLSERQCLLKELLGTPPILRGSFHQVYTRCGKPNCWCAKAQKGHPHTRLTWSEAGMAVTRKVPVSEEEQVGKLTDNYRCFQQQRRQIIALDLQIQNRLDEFETALISEVRDPLPFLALRSRMPAKNKKLLQPARNPKKQNT